MRPLILGAVAYDPKVVTIWDGFLAFFATNNLAFDYVLYTNYESLAAALLRGQVDVAWNSPLAWIEVDRGARQLGMTARAIAMRDTDQDLTSVIVVRADSPIQSIADLGGKILGVGAGDSPQATLIPRLCLAEAGVEAALQRHDVLLGKHGDHVGGERDAARALLEGRVQAAAILDANLVAFGRDGTLPPGSVRVIYQTPKYDHCNFTVVTESDMIAQFVAILLHMDYADPHVRPLMDLEGLKSWKLARTEGYGLLERACDRFGTLDDFLQSLG